MKMTTERTICRAFAQLLEEKPYGRITIGNIVDRCGISRNTFYYHFKNIEALFESAVQDWADSFDLEHCRFETPMDCLAPVVTDCLNHRRLIQCMIRSSYREMFYRTLEKLVLKVVTRFVELNASTDVLPSEQKLIIRFYKCALMGQLYEWIDSGLSYDLMSFASHVSSLLLKSEWKKAPDLARELPKKSEKR